MNGGVGGTKDRVNPWSYFSSLRVLGRWSRSLRLSEEEVLVRFLPSSWGQMQYFDRLAKWLQGFGASGGTADCCCFSFQTADLELAGALASYIHVLLFLGAGASLKRIVACCL